MRRVREVVRCRKSKKKTTNRVQTRLDANRTYRNGLPGFRSRFGQWPNRTSSSGSGLAEMVKNRTELNFGNTIASAKLKTVILVLTSFRNPPSRSLTRVLTKFLMFMFAHFGIGPSTCFQTPFFLLTLFGMPSACTSTTAALLFIFFMNLGLEIVSGTYKYVVYIIF